MSNLNLDKIADLKDVESIKCKGRLEEGEMSCNINWRDGKKTEIKINLE